MPMLMPYFSSGKHWYNECWKAPDYKGFPKVVHFAFCIILLYSQIFFFAAKSQTLSFRYNLYLNKDKIGWITVAQKGLPNDSIFINLQSVVKFRVVLSFITEITEHYLFYKNQLQFSTLNHKVNGNDRVKLKNIFTERSSAKSENTQYFNTRVSYNLPCLYFKEPTAQNRVFVDKTRSFQNITKQKDGGYKVIFADGSSNTYYYKNGICTRVIIVHSLYKVKAILIP